MRRPPLRIEPLEARVTPAVAGSLDPSFGGDGTATAGTMDRPDVVVDAAGRVVVAGTAAGDMVVARLNPDGTPDTTFGTGGRVTIDFNGGDDAAAGVALDPFGNVVVAGTTGLTTNALQAAVARLTPAGQLDPTFGTGGKAVVTAPGTVLVSAVTVDSLGRVVAAGTNPNWPATPAGPQSANFLALRLLPDGTVDAGFGDAGFAVVDFGSIFTPSRATAVAVDGAGHVVLAGTRSVPFGSHFTRNEASVARLTDAGQLDPAFDTDGKVTFNVGSGTSTSPAGVAVGPGGAVYLAGSDSYGSNPPAPFANTRFFAARLTAGGQLDPAFGTGGVFAPDTGPTATGSGAVGVAVGPDGKVYVAGGVNVFNVGGNFGVLRLTPAGQLDPTFAPASATPGITSFGDPPGTDGGVAPSGLALAPDGKVVVTGTHDTTAVAARLFAATDPAESTTLVVSGGADGKASVYVPNPSTGQYATTPAATLVPFPGFAGSVRTAAGDVNGDGVEDIIAVTGPGTPARFVVIDGRDRTSLLVPPTDPFGGNFAGGGFVAAGDINGDGRAEWVITPDQGGGPNVVIYSLAAGTTVPIARAFFALGNPGFRGGARPAIGDVNADGFADLAVGAGFLGGPNVELHDGKAVAAGDFAALIGGQFFAFPGADADTLRNGVYLAVGDVDGDGFADLVAGGGPGGGPRVLVLSGKLLAAGDVAGAYAAPVANFFVAGNESDRGGVRVAAKDVDGDARADLIVGSGEGLPPRVRVYPGGSVGGAGEPGGFQDLTPAVATLPNGAVADGVFVG